MENIVLINPKDLKQIVKDAIIELEQDNLLKGEGEKTYSINGVSKRLKMAHATIKKLVLSGIIKSTKSGRITEKAINEYLQKS